MDENDFLSDDAGEGEEELEDIDYEVAFERDDNTYSSGEDEHPGEELRTLAKNGQLAEVKRFVKTHPCSTIHEGDRHGRTPLYLAAREGKVAVVEFLLHQGARQELRDDGADPLFVAVQNGHLDVVRKLLSVDEHGQMRSPERTECARRLNLRRHDGCTGLILASQYKRIEMVRMVIEMGADASICAQDGASALFLAADDGCVGVCEIILDAVPQLLDKPDDVDLETPLYRAVAMGHSDVVRFLLDRGANPLKNPLVRDRTLLKTACIYSRVEIAQLLVEHGVDVNEENALLFACLSQGTRRAQTVEMLLKMGGDPSVICEHNGERVRDYVLGMYRRLPGDALRVLMDKKWWTLANRARIAIVRNKVAVPVDLVDWLQSLRLL